MATAKEILSNSIRTQFDAIDFKMDWVYGKAQELILTAKSYGLDELADEMLNDLP